MWPMKTFIRDELRRRVRPHTRARLGRLYGPLQRYESVIPRTLASHPGKAVHGGFTARRVNMLASLLPACSTYLEVGVFRGTTLEAADVPFRVGVDPVPQFDTNLLPAGVIFFSGDSDTYFDQLDTRVKFDLVYLDGLHEWKQTLRDLAHSLEHTHAYSLILLDDVQPVNALSSVPDMDTSLSAQRNQGVTTEEWQGDVYKVLVYLQLFVPGLRFVVLQEPGCNIQAVIWKVDPDVAIKLERGYPEEVDQTTYDEVFPAGVTPTAFRPISESALPEVLAAESLVANYGDVDSPAQLSSAGN